MILNNEQNAAVGFPDSICLAACPGSGKTRTIIAKILRSVTEVVGTTRRVACITYTHAAVDEILKRVREYGSTSDLEYCEVSTIHSFCLNNILQPHYHRLPELAQGFGVIAPESEKWKSLVRNLAERYDVDMRRLDSFSGIHREPDGSLFFPDTIPQDAAEEFIRRLDQERLVSFSDIVFHSTRIIRNHQFVARGLASRFAWLLVDEFQDTSAGQVEILSHIAEHNRTKIFMVGDKNQSIMGFTGANPELMGNFAQTINAHTDIALRGNYRCSGPIVNHAERLLPSAPPMYAVGVYERTETEPIYVNCASSTECIFHHFIPELEARGIQLGDAAVLAPWWSALFGLSRGLRNLNIPVIGPGSRPYQRSNDFATLAEHLSAYTEQPTPDLFHATQRALFITVLHITGEPIWAIYQYPGRKALYRIIGIVRELKTTYPNATDWLLHASDLVGRVLVEEEFLPILSKDVLSDSARNMVRQIHLQIQDTANMTVDDLGVYARPKDCLHLLTMHSSKGREFEAIAIVDLHDGRVPDFRSRTNEDFAQDRRLLYVAMTRPKKLLMYCTDDSNWRNRPSRFLEELGIV
jgi:DNA helicase-2/ATP-dependent DNA helicase PcrA